MKRICIKKDTLDKTHDEFDIPELTEADFKRAIKKEEFIKLRSTMKISDNKSSFAE